MEGGVQAALDVVDFDAVHSRVGDAPGNVADAPVEVRHSALRPRARLDVHDDVTQPLDPLSQVPFYLVGDVVGLVEVMKSFNEVKSEVEGKLVRFLVENEDAVMAGQPLAELEG